MRISTSAFRAAARGGSRRPLARPATTAVRERALHTSASLASGGNQQHHFTADNQDDETFDFTAQSYERVHTILAKYPNNYKQSGMIPLLDLAQRQVKEQTGRSFLPLSAMNKVAQILGVMPMRVYEVATFYTMFHRERVGRFFIQLCGTTPCMACGAPFTNLVRRHHCKLRRSERNEARPHADQHARDLAKGQAPSAWPMGTRFAERAVAAVARSVSAQAGPHMFRVMHHGGLA